MGGILGGIGSIAGGIFGGPAGAAAGGLLGGMLDGNSETNGGAGASSSTRTPWGPAQPYLLNNLERNQQLQDHYTKNPFNSQQQAGYQNLFSDLDNFRGNVAPGLMDFANNAMQHSYQRQSPSAVGRGGYEQHAQPSGPDMNGIMQQLQAMQRQQEYLRQQAAQQPPQQPHNTGIVPPNMGTATSALTGTIGSAIGNAGGIGGIASQILGGAHGSGVNPNTGIVPPHMGGTMGMPNALGASPQIQAPPMPPEAIQQAKAMPPQQLQQALAQLPPAVAQQVMQQIQAPTPAPAPNLGMGATAPVAPRPSAPVVQPAPVVAAPVQSPVPVRTAVRLPVSRFTRQLAR